MRSAGISSGVVQVLQVNLDIPPSETSIEGVPRTPLKSRWLRDYPSACEPRAGRTSP